MDAGEYYAECMAFGRIREVDPALLDAVGYVPESDYAQMKDDADRGAKTKAAASAGGNARASASGFLLKYEEARRYMLKYHQDNPKVSFSQARRKAAQHLDLGESTLKKYLKKGDFADW